MTQQMILSTSPNLGNKTKVFHIFANEIEESINKLSQEIKDPFLEIKLSSLITRCKKKEYPIKKILYSICNIISKNTTGFDISIEHYSLPGVKVQNDNFGVDSTKNKYDIYFHNNDSLSYLEDIILSSSSEESNSEPPTKVCKLEDTNEHLSEITNFNSSPKAQDSILNEVVLSPLQGGYSEPEDNPIAQVSDKQYEETNLHLLEQNIESEELSYGEICFIRNHIFPLSIDAGEKKKLRNAFVKYCETQFCSLKMNSLRNAWNIRILENNNSFSKAYKDVLAYFYTFNEYVNKVKSKLDAFDRTLDSREHNFNFFDKFFDNSIDPLKCKNCQMHCLPKLRSRLSKPPGRPTVPKTQKTSNNLSRDQVIKKPSLKQKRSVSHSDGKTL